MFKKSVDTPTPAIAVSTIEKLIQPTTDRSQLQVTVRHVHEYQGSGLMEAFLALLTAILFIFGSVCLAIAASNFYHATQVNQTS